MSQESLKVMEYLIFTFDVTRVGSRINSKGFFTHSTDFIRDLSSRYFANIQIENLTFGRFERQKKVTCAMAILTNVGTRGFN